MWTLPIISTSLPVLDILTILLRNMAMRSSCAIKIEALVLTRNIRSGDSLQNYFSPALRSRGSSASGKLGRESRFRGVESFSQSGDITISPNCDKLFSRQTV